MKLEGRGSLALVDKVTKDRSSTDPDTVSSKLNNSKALYFNGRNDKMKRKPRALMLGSENSCVQIVLVCMFTERGWNVCIHSLLSGFILTILFRICKHSHLNALGRLLQTANICATITTVGHTLIAIYISSTMINNSQLNLLQSTCDYKTKNLLSFETMVVDKQTKKQEFDLNVKKALKHF